ncbi:MULTISPECIES: protoporphyrinogen oxidase [Streptomyces]|uniref:Coproporphyrinogen III oxidase n=1 Tax=Streptomyces evansiae TaxID=3075535 RepID=A0ABU2R3S9_9ACTN|nr:MULTISPECIES: protoporphyrinogen oxidase [unclassified Streptomyces]MDT0410069.1 protoporphyrinogen oxidase [Streptomyces sp. DSM 41979]MYQ61636.1 protoporphyrinogen oxidase [Streptomyces sp. SID4926]SCD51925.1 oxygen-dependent protoporphyrinogen oxidase [Streptomyces sp. DfronAA-171]
MSEVPSSTPVSATSSPSPAPSPGVPAPGPAPRLLVLGGGITGLAAALHAVDAGARVTLVEAAARLGGKLRSGEIEGVRVDFGAESMLARRPEAVALARAAGLGHKLQPPNTASASLWTRDALRPMPKGHVMGVPAEAASLAGVLSDEGLRRIDAEAELPPEDLGDDVAIGEYVARRLGREVVDRLVEPLLGGVYAGNAYRISMRAAVPQLWKTVQEHPRLTDAVRAAQANAAHAAGGKQPGGPVFQGLKGGLGTLPLAVARTVRDRGGEIRTGTAAEELRRTPDAWRVVLTNGGVLEADAVVIALPAPRAARLLDAESPAAAAELRAVEYASMALVTLAYRRADTAALPAGSSGFLVPPVDGRTIKASTFSSQKWAWVDEENPELLVLRTSLGRHGDTADLARDDAELVSLSRRDLRLATGLDARPLASVVTRWNDGLPQYPVGHQGRVARVREHVAKLPGLAVCGAAYDGVGIPACVASAREAVDGLLAVD